MEEIWKDIFNWEGRYQISNLGNIKSLINNKGILKFTVTSKGYHRITLQSNKRIKKYFVHRLVLQTFIGNSDLQVNHKNGIKTDNKLENLEYCTASENLKHAYKTKLKSNVGINHSQAVLTEEQVYRIKFIAKHYDLKKGYWAKVARCFKVNSGTILAIVHNKSWKHIIA